MKQPLCILFLIETSDPGGAEIALTNLAAGLDRQAFRPVVGLLRAGWLSQQLRERKVETVILTRGAKGYADLRLLRSIMRTAKRVGADVIHSFMFYMNIYGAMAARLTRRPAIISVRGMGYDFCCTRNILAYRLAARICTRMTAVSEEMAQYLREVTGVAGRKLLTIPNGVDSARFRPRPELREPVRAECGIPPEAPVIGTVGRLEAVKRQGDLLRALATLTPQIPDLHALILGEGSLRRELEALAGQLGVADRVHLPGFRDDVERVLPAMDVFVLPSISEGMPNALLQAMAAGLPTVASEVGGSAEVVDPGVTGLLVPAGDPYALAEAISGLLVDRARALCMGEAGRQRVEARYSEQAFLRRHQELYREVARGR